MFCGILPWTWFASSLSDAAGSLIAGGNLIKKVLFPAEVLPIVSVLANMVHFFLGLVILIAFLALYRHPPDAWDLFWFPVAVLVQLVFTCARGPGGSFSRHPRHPRERPDALVLRDADHLPVFPGQRAEVPAAVQRQPVHPPRDFLPGDPVLLRPDRPLALAARARRRVDSALPRLLLGVRSPARFVCGGGVTTAIELAHVSKVYRRYSGKQFATLKSALLQRSILRDLRPNE